MLLGRSLVRPGARSVSVSGDDACLESSAAEEFGCVTRMIGFDVLLKVSSLSKKLVISIPRTLEDRPCPD